MINLLPPSLKQEYSYGLRNRSLIRWISGIVVSLVGLGIIATYGLLTLQHSIHTYNTQVDTATAALKKQHLTQTEDQVKGITNNFKLVVQVLSKEVLFSKLLKQMATIIPPGATLTGFTIGQTNSGIDITAAVASSNTATQLQVNLQDPANKIFSKADIVNIACQAKPQDPAYPCTVELKALLAPNNPFLFISNTSKAANP